MKFRAGIVLPLIMLTVTPVVVFAQQAPSASFAIAPSMATPLRLDFAQDPPSQRPDDVMSTSGIFLGIVAMLGGAVVGSAVSQNSCEETDEEGCRSRNAFTGALIAGTLAVPLGVHIANKQPGSLWKSLGVSILAGTALYYGTKAIPGEPIQIAPFLSAPLQAFSSIKIEKATRKTTP
jgi:hypothetical protein